MKRLITITIEIDPAEYQDAEDTEEGAVELVKACLRQEADLPSLMHITCGERTWVLDLEEPS